MTEVPKITSFYITFAIVITAASELFKNPVEESPSSTISKIGQAERSFVELDMTE